MLCTNQDWVLAAVAALRLGSLPTGPADFHLANVTVNELRAGINMLEFAGPAAGESPQEVFARGSSLDRPPPGCYMRVDAVRANAG
jgi:hypothetical protein